MSPDDLDVSDLTRLYKQPGRKTSQKRSSPSSPTRKMGRIRRTRRTGSNECTCILGDIADCSDTASRPRLFELSRTCQCTRALEATQDDPSIWCGCPVERPEPRCWARSCSSFLLLALFHCSDFQVIERMIVVIVFFDERQTILTVVL